MQSCQHCSDTDLESTKSSSNEDSNSKNKEEKENSNENNTKDGDTSSMKIIERMRGRRKATVCKGCGRVDAEQNAVLAGDPKVFRLLCNTNLNMNIPSRGSEEERIRIPCGCGLIYRVTDIINKTEINKYMSVPVRYRTTWHASAALVGSRSEAVAGREQQV